ncbi:MAG: sulfite exporter TauE/SafE family protein [Chloroflexota bacterium]
MIDTSLWFLVATGLASGLLGAMLGIGGGVFIIPVLTLLVRLPMHIAVGSSLVVVVATAATAAGRYAYAGITDIRLGLLLSTTTVVGAIGGALVAPLLASGMLKTIFGMLQFFVAYSMVAGHRHGADGQEAPEGATHVPQGIGLSLFGGILSGLLGIGGGIVNLPVLHLVMKVPLKTAIATSSLMIALTASASALVYAYEGYIYPGIVAPLAVGTMGGAWVGARLGYRASNRALRLGFAAILVVVGVMMGLQGRGILLT